MGAYLTDEAQQDIDDAWEHLALTVGNRVAGDRFLDEIERVIDLIAAHPEIGRLRPELGAGVRSFPHGRYTIFYRAQERLVDVLRVLHQRRDVAEAFDAH